MATRPIETSPLLQAQYQIHALEQGHWGSPGAAGRPMSLLAAENDFEAIHEYLVAKCQKPTTHKAMTGAILKLLVFLRVQGLDSLQSIKLRHCSEFQTWLQHPEPAFVSSAGKPPPYWLTLENRPNPEWRPFRAPMNAVTAQQTLNRISTLFQWMSDAGYLPGNPWKLTSALTEDTRLGQHGDAGKSERELPFSCIEAIRHYLDHGAAFTDDGQGLGPDAPRLPALAPRVFAHRRWIFNFYFYTAARVSSGCLATLDDIFLDDQDIPMLSLVVKGHGVKRHPVPWVPELQDEYYRYRAAMDLPAEPVRPRSSAPKPGEPSSTELAPRHLLLPLRLGRQRQASTSLSYSTVYAEIGGLFEYVQRWVDRHPELGLTDREKAILARASGHWVRHGTAALLGNYAQVQLGHRYESTTQSYQVAKRQAQIARLQSIGELAVEDDALYALLEAPDEDRLRWLMVLAESYIKADNIGADDRKRELVHRIANL
ncbi:hypothetical protein [Saccharospirillum mangrovi]|uniref:hypothetical protein n=1 Tax=Saccharospirillum mangrovi TaxID=2161747 RepID=UPI000D35F5E2|nr:hypothetical protein [Saccharospirillum mangrovi]